MPDDFPVIEQFHDYGIVRGWSRRREWDPAARTPMARADADVRHIIPNLDGTVNASGN